jgi:CRP-like cAMP-binding protein
MDHGPQMIRRNVLGREDTREMLVRRLSRMAPLETESKELIIGLEGRQAHRPRSEFGGQRGPGARPRFILTGWAAWTRNLSDGRRQILGFLLPGDPVGLYLRPHPIALWPVTALTAVQTVDAAPVQAALSSGEPRWKGLAEALRVSAGLYESYLLDQVTRLGRLTAYERMCHLLLELRDRLQLVGLGDASRFPMPLTQEVLADATGLSVVHVNRVLQQLRRERIIDLRSGVVSLLQPDAMVAVSDYASPEISRWSAGAG